MKKTPRTQRFAKKYREWKPLTLKQVLVDLKYGYLARQASFVTDFGVCLREPRIQFVALHQLFNEHMAKFDKLLSYLANYYSFISYSEAVERILNGRIDNSYMAFSCDDGFRNNLNLASVLENHGATCCFFVCTSMIDEVDYQAIRIFCEERLFCRPVEFLRGYDIEYLLKRGHEIGGHTVSHPNMATLSEKEVQEEVLQCYDVILKKFGQPAHFAWPYGKLNEFSACAARKVFEAGFISCASVERGYHDESVKDMERLFVCRDCIDPRWSIKRVLYFLGKSTKTSSPVGNCWPKEWNS